MFIDREREMKLLNARYRSEQFELAAVYGPPGVGKTAFALRFLEGKRAIYFNAQETSAKQSLGYFSERVRRFDAENSELIGDFSTFQEAFEHIFRLASEERLVVLIDDYPLLAKASKNLSYYLPALIDQYAAGSRLMLVLCGSISGDSVLLDDRSGLSGYQTVSIPLSPFDFAEISAWFRGYSPVDVVLAYGMLGGLPRHLCQFDRGQSIEQNVTNTFFSPDSRLFHEATLLLRQEFREPGMYNAILTAIACGADNLTAISKAVDESSSAASVYLKNLVSRGFIRRSERFDKSGVSKKHYRIEDPFLRFWYRFVPEHQNEIVSGSIDGLYQKLQPQLNSYMKDVFIDVCRQFLMALRDSERSPVSFLSLGRSVTSDIPIDLVGTDGDSVLFAACYWQDEPFDLPRLNETLSYGDGYGFARSYYYIFSKSGFSESCSRHAAQNESIVLVSL